MRALVVGDLHVVPEELPDCDAVVALILKLCRSEDIQEVWFSGDQHHTNAVVRLEVMNWWRITFKALKAQGINSVCLVGNHDQAYPGSVLHAMLAYESIPGVKVVDHPVIRKGVLMLPYYHEEKDFLAACNKHHKDQNEFDQTQVLSRTVFCHQTFNGSTYENGFLASDGFDPNLVPQELIISGHIHTGQEFGKVWYVGAPRWRSLSDANVDRALWLLEFDEGKLVKRIPYSTGDVCRQIKHLDDTPDAPVQLPLDLKHQWRIDIKGPQDWCHARKTELRAAGARIRTFPEQVKVAGKVRESQGVDQAFAAFLDLYQAKHGTDKEVLAKMAKERLSG